MAAARQRQLIEAGQRAPNFALPDLNGVIHTLSEILKTGPAVLAFFKTTCPTCQYTFPFLGQLHDPAGSMRILAISQDGERDTREFMDEWGCSFPALLDDVESYGVSNAYGISLVPSIVIVEPDGQIAQSWHGWLKADMEALAGRLSIPLFRDDQYVPAWKAG